MATTVLNGPPGFDVTGAYTPPEQTNPATAIGQAGAAQITLDGLTGLGATFANIRPHIGRSVWAKRNWEDAWEYLPEIWPDECVERVSPGVSECTMHYDFGLIDRYLRGWAVWYPYDVARAFIRVLGHTPYSEALLFCGVCDVQTFDLDASWNFASGRQKMRAFGLEHLLDRAVVRGSYTADGYVSRPIEFNERRRGRSRGLIGNRTSNDLTFGGTAEWSNLDIIDYLLTHAAPGGITWRVSGSVEALASMVEVHRLEGLTILQCLRKLIPRQRGLGWKIVTNGYGAVYIEVHSCMPYAISGPTFSMPANPRQTFINTNGRPDLRFTLDFQDVAEYDYIVAKGGPVTTVFSLSFAEGTLANGWNPFDEVFYIAGTGTPTDDAGLHDSKRTTDQFSRIYQAFRVPDNWDGYAGDPANAGDPRYPVTPICLWDGTVTYLQEGVMHRPGKTFLRYLPIEEENPVDTSTPEYRAPFVVVLTETQNGDAVYQYVNDLDAIDKTPASVRMGDRDLEIHVKPRGVPHVAALNHFPDVPDPEEDQGATNKPPEYDYEEYIATVAMETDTHLEVRIAVPPVSATGRLKLISVPDAVAWYVSPGTVLDVGDVQANDATTELRNDRIRLLNIAVLAAAWYGYQRATARIEINGSISLGGAPGSLIVGVANNGYWANVGTVVSERRLDLNQNKTVITTAFRELDFEEMGRDR